jgi:hypothetical protein
MENDGDLACDGDLRLFHANPRLLMTRRRMGAKELPACYAVPSSSRAHSLHSEDRRPAISCTFGAHLRAEFAMRVIVAGAFFRAELPDPGAYVEHGAQRRDVLPCPTHRNLRGGVTHIRTVQT